MFIEFYERGERHWTIHGRSALHFHLMKIQVGMERN